MVNLIVRLVFSVCYLLLILRALAPFIDRSRTNNWLRPVYSATDWLLNLFRVAMPPEKIGMDVAPYVAIILLYLAERFFF